MLNVQSDHLGLKGIDTLEQLAEVKRVVVEVATDCAVLNADDPLVLRMSGYTDAKSICYVTLNPQHTLVREHIRAGGRACALEAGVNGQMITLYDRGGHIPLVWTHLIPATLEGRALHNVQNAMFAAAMAFSLGIKLDAIRQGLRTFDSTFYQAPGRMNVFDEHPFKVLFDYGHNAHAVGMLADLAQRLEVKGRRIVVLAGPGDRRDEDLVAIANAVAGRFDHYVCRRDDNLRDRAPDEVPRIQAAALRAAGVARGGDLRDSRRAAGDRGGAADGSRGRPAAGFRRRTGALVEAGDEVPHGRRRAIRRPPANRWQFAGRVPRPLGSPACASRRRMDRRAAASCRGQAGPAAGESGRDLPTGGRCPAALESRRSDSGRARRAHLPRRAKTDGPTRIAVRGLEATHRRQPVLCLHRRSPRSCRVSADDVVARGLARTRHARTRASRLGIGSSPRAIVAARRCGPGDCGEAACRWRVARDHARPATSYSRPPR